MSSNALYLHGGPGLNAGVERAWFGNSLPVVWWDQPSIAAGGRPFETLVRACESKLRAMAESQREPVRLIASSFGGQVAVTLASAVPSLIESITLLGCIPDLPIAFVRLGTRLLTEHPEDSRLRAAVEAVRNGMVLPTELLMTIIGACSPYLPAAWFAPHSCSAIKRFTALASELRFDADSFSAVLADFLAASPPRQPSSFSGSVRLFLGQHDRFLDPDADEKIWRNSFPNLVSTRLDCGHAVQFEAAPLLWA